MWEHVWHYYTAMLRHYDHIAKYDATPDRLNQSWHVGAYYMAKCSEFLYTDAATFRV